MAGYSLRPSPLRRECDQRAGLRGDDADRLSGDRHQDPAHQKLLRPSSPPRPAEESDTYLLRFPARGHRGSTSGQHRPGVAAVAPATRLGTDPRGGLCRHLSPTMTLQGRRWREGAACPPGKRWTCGRMARPWQLPPQPSCVCCVQSPRPSPRGPLWHCQSLSGTVRTVCSATASPRPLIRLLVG